MARKVSEVMSRGVATVGPDDTVKHAAVKMEAYEIGPLPVCEHGRMIGILTDRDITVRAVASGRDPNTTPVREVMTIELAYCFEDNDVDDAVELMRRREIRRLPVLDRDHRLVGILALADLALRTDTDTKAEALENVSRPSDTSR